MDKVIEEFCKARYLTYKISLDAFTMRYIITLKDVDGNYIAGEMAVRDMYTAQLKQKLEELYSTLKIMTN